jgi:predicted permease
MTPLRVLWRRIAGALGKGSLERDLDVEFDFHLQMEIEENLRQGMTPEEARNRALARFGRVAEVKESYRETRSLPFVEVLWHDLRFGVRMLGRSPGFVVLTVSCLTLGIGATTAVFSWLEGVCLRPFPMVSHQERMLAIIGTNRGVAGEVGESIGISWPDFQDFEKNCTLFDAFIADRITGTTLSTGARAQVVNGSIVSANYFDALGVRPMLGRGFRPEDNVGRNAHPVMVIGYQLWKELFRGDPSIIGKIQKLNGVPHTIIGVAPEHFYGTFAGRVMHFWAPVSMLEVLTRGGSQSQDRRAGWIEGYVRLKPGVTLPQAQVEISAVAKRLEEQYPATNRGHGVKLFPLYRTPFNQAGNLLPTLSIALTVAVFVLLIVCANVSNLLLVKSFGRRHEMTVRQAVGAGRGRLLKQLLTEGLILAAVASIGGLLVANWSRNLLMLLPPALGLYLPGELDWRVLALSTGVSLTATLLFGLAPAVQASKVDLVTALKGETGGVVGGGRKALFRSSLVVVQVALSFLLLVGVGLMLKSLTVLLNTNPGFSTHDVLHSSVDLTAAGYDPQRMKNFEKAMTDHLAAQPGVESVVFSSDLPFSYGAFDSAPIAVDGYTAGPDEKMIADYSEVGPGYLRTFRIPLVAGREFTGADNENTPRVAIVNEAMAAQYWRGRDPVGSRLQVKGQWASVIGIAKTIKYANLREAPRMFVYLAMRQGKTGEEIFIRASVGPEAVRNMLLREVHALDPDLVPEELITMQEQVGRTTAVRRASVMMLGIFGGQALLLAAIGLYGVMAYNVSQGVREVGLRMALGAKAADIVQRVISNGLVMAAAGIVLGTVVGLASTRLMGNLLYQVNPRDPVVFSAAAVVMIVAALAACFLPAWRATRTDPVRALRD